MRTLGVVLAGGQARRFGSDKAMAMFAGRTLIAHAIDALRLQCAAVVVAGRDAAPVATVEDWPRPGMGPLGGICGALRHAAREGFEAILTVPVDAIGLPPDLLTPLMPAPACVASQPVIGLWPAATLDPLADLLCSDARHSLIALAELTGARRVTLAVEPVNINSPEDLEQLTELPPAASH